MYKGRPNSSKKDKLTLFNFFSIDFSLYLIAFIGVKSADKNSKTNILYVYTLDSRAIVSIIYPILIDFHIILNAGRPTS